MREETVSDVLAAMCPSDEQAPFLRRLIAAAKREAFEEASAELEAWAMRRCALSPAMSADAAEDIRALAAKVTP